MAASSYGYETVISVTINRDGTVSDYNVEKSSGNSYFDQTAIRAIKRASPLPPFPPSWLQKSINIGIKFSCKEGCQ
jgi:TonB family protein